MPAKSKILRALKTALCSHLTYMMIWQTRLGYRYTILDIDIEKIAAMLCESRTNNRFARYNGNKGNYLTLSD